VKQFRILKLKNHKDDVIASNFILQSKTVQSILEVTYRLADIVDKDCGISKIETFDLLHDIELLKELHIHQLAKLGGMSSLKKMLSETRPKYRKDLIKKVLDYTEIYYEGFGVERVKKQN